MSEAVSGGVPPQRSTSWCQERRERSTAFRRVFAGAPFWVACCLALLQPPSVHLCNASPTRQRQLQNNSAKGSSKRGWMEDVHRPRDEVVVSADADGRLLRLREPSEPIQAAVQRMLVRA